MNRLKELREQKKISQSELANLTNVKQNTISNWEQNKTEIDQNNLLLLADYFGVTLDYLLCRDMTDNLKKYPNSTPIKKAPRLRRAFIL